MKRIGIFASFLCEGMGVGGGNKFVWIVFCVNKPVVTRVMCGYTSIKYEGICSYLIDILSLRMLLDVSLRHTSINDGEKGFKRMPFPFICSTLRKIN